MSNHLNHSLDHFSTYVMTGSSVLAAAGFDRLKGTNVGFIGNHTSKLSDGTSTLLALMKSGVCNVQRIFSPEHGASGKYDEDVNDELDPRTGLTIHSLYGEHRKPTARMLSGLDYLIFELQDVGARFYTYSATLLLAIDAAYENNTKLLVLDRPNPIAGVISDGPIVDPDRISFIAPYTLPVQTGITLAELGKLYAIETQKNDCVEVAAMSGWKRRLFFDDTGLEWTIPSPAMQSLATATTYPGVCLVEQANISVGRGTEKPFEQIGAPYIDASNLADYLNAMNIAGLKVKPVDFVPTSSVFFGEKCYGVRLIVTDRQIFRPLLLGAAITTVLSDLYSPLFNIDSTENMIANNKTTQLLQRSCSGTEIYQDWQKLLGTWHNRRERCLLYA